MERFLALIQAAENFLHDRLILINGSAMNQQMIQASSHSMQMHTKMLDKIKCLYFNNHKQQKQHMEKTTKTTKQSQIKQLLSQDISLKEIAEQMKTNIAYVYKIKRDLKKQVSE